jgi:hypothetical protein
LAERYYTTSTAFLEALAEAGVRYVFANLGSDHPGLIEALAQLNAEDGVAGFPQVIICPHEAVAVSARARLRDGDRGAAGRHRARRRGHPEPRRRGEQCDARSRPGARLRRIGAVHPGRRAARRPQRVHPLDPGRPRPARHPARLREVRQRDPHRPEREAARAPRPADRPQRARGPGVPDHPARGDGRAGRALRRRPGGLGPVAPVALTEGVIAEIATALAGARHPLLARRFAAASARLRWSRSPGSFGTKSSSTRLRSRSGGW